MKTKERGKRLDRDAYEPPARDLITAAEVAEAMGMRVHSVLQAIRRERLWAVNLSTGARANYFTTWRAVVDWTTSGFYAGPYSTEDER